MMAMKKGKDDHLSHVIAHRVPEATATFVRGEKRGEGCRFYGGNFCKVAADKVGYILQ